MTTKYTEEWKAKTTVKGLMNAKNEKRSCIKLTIVEIE
jgi:hypothetical protein